MEVLQEAAWVKAEAIRSILDGDEISMDDRAAYLAISEAYRAVHDQSGVHLRGDSCDQDL